MWRFSSVNNSLQLVAFRVSKQFHVKRLTSVNTAKISSRLIRNSTHYWDSFAVYFVWLSFELEIRYQEFIIQCNDVSNHLISFKTLNPNYNRRWLSVRSIIRFSILAQTTDLIVDQWHRRTVCMQTIQAEQNLIFKLSNICLC